MDYNTFPKVEIMILPPKQQLNFFEHYPRVTAAPDVLQAYICDHLDKRSLANLKQITTGAKFFVEKKHRKLSIYRDPKHLGRIRTYEDLSALQKLQLEFIKFYDRPKYQRCLIVVGCVLLSPVILVWHSPKMVKAGFNYIIYPYFILPCFKALFYIGDKIITYIIQPAIESIVWLCKSFNTYIIRPVLNGTVCLCKLINSYIIQPAIKAISCFCNAVNVHIIQPGIAQSIKIKDCIYETILIPIAVAIKWIGNAIWNCTTYCVNCVGAAIGWIGDNIVSPVFHKVVYPYILVPIGKIIKFVLRTIFISIPCFVWKYFFYPICKGIQWIFVRCVFPTCKWIYVILKGICVGFATKVFSPVLSGAYNYILAPMGRCVSNLCNLSVEYVIKPSFNFISICSQAVYEYVLCPVGLLISSIGNLFTSK